MLIRLKNNEFKVNQWTEKTQTLSAVKRKIQDMLFEQLPYPTFEDKDVTVKTKLLFNEFKTRFASYQDMAA